MLASIFVLLLLCSGKKVYLGTSSAETPDPLDYYYHLCNVSIECTMHHIDLPEVLGLGQVLDDESLLNSTTKVFLAIKAVDWTVQHSLVVDSLVASRPWWFIQMVPDRRVAYLVLERPPLALLPFFQTMVRQLHSFHSLYINQLTFVHTIQGTSELPSTRAVQCEDDASGVSTRRHVGQQTIHS